MPSLLNVNILVFLFKVRDLWLFLRGHCRANFNIVVSQGIGALRRGRGLEKSQQVKQAEHIQHLPIKFAVLSGWWHPKTMSTLSSKVTWPEITKTTDYKNYQNMTQRHKASKCWWKNSADRLGQHRVTKILQFVKDSVSAISVKRSTIKGGMLVCQMNEFCLSFSSC